MSLVKPELYSGIGLWNLRPYERDDISELIQLRTNPDTTQFLPRVSPVVSDQIKWFETYMNRDNDFMFTVVHHERGVQGFIAIYEISGGIGEWGRWVLKPGSLAAVPSVFLLFGIAFGLLGLSSITCRTIQENRAVLSFHDHLGQQRIGISSVNELPAIVHQVTFDRWPEISQRLFRISARIV